MTTLANRMGDTYRIVHACTMTANRAAGLVALVSPDAGSGAAIEAYRRGVTVGMASDKVRDLPDGRTDITLAHKAAAGKFRARIMRLAERAGAMDTFAMLKSVSPTDIAHEIDANGGVAFACPVLGTFAVLRDDVTVGTNEMAAAVGHASAMRDYATQVRDAAIEAHAPLQITA